MAGHIESFSPEWSRAQNQILEDLAIDVGCDHHELPQALLPEARASQSRQHRPVAHTMGDNMQDCPLREGIDKVLNEILQMFDRPVVPVVIDAISGNLGLGRQPQATGIA